MDEIKPPFTPMDASEDKATNLSQEDTIGQVISKRFNRRKLLQATLGVTAINGLFSQSAWALKSIKEISTPPSQPFDFDEISHGVSQTHQVANGYQADVLLRWGDSLASGTPDLQPLNQTRDDQLKQFGYNCDYIGYMPLPAGSINSENGLLFVNHEYTTASLMFPGLNNPGQKRAPNLKEVEIELAAHGASVVEVKRDDKGQWHPVSDSQYNRRINAYDTEMRLSGPVAGHERVKTSADPSGTKVIGMLSNCAGGITPWGTVLTAEENFNGHFTGDVEKHPESAAFKRYGVPTLWYNWGDHVERFNINKEHNEANRFGWIVEVNPYDPQSMPIKRTALGRFKHEGATSIVNKDGRVVIYSGDDQRFEYLYRFVTKNKYHADNPMLNRDLLDEGILSVARFSESGDIEWRDLVWGQGPLIKANGFNSQADVLIETRRAADLVGATPLDRPEDVEPNPKTQKVYVMLTNNTKRKTEDEDSVNPRGPNPFGHILELSPPNGDHSAKHFSWEILVQCGDPNNPNHNCHWHSNISDNGWFASPDNGVIDAQGRLWVASDQGTSWPLTGTSDGLWGVSTEGETRGCAWMFFRAPVGAEVCGPAFTPDNETLFLSVQHPAADGTMHYSGFERESTFDDPATRWPDFKEKTPPKPSVLAITKTGGGKIG